MPRGEVMVSIESIPLLTGSEAFQPMAISTLYLIGVLCIGFIAYLYAGRSAEVFFLASRSFGTIVGMFTLFATLISIFWLFPYIMLQQTGAGTALHALTNGAVPYWAGAGYLTVFMIVYVFLAGMRGVAWTDTVQGIMMFSIIGFAFVWIVYVTGGPSVATQSMAEVNPDFLALGTGIYSPQFIITTVIEPVQEISAENSHDVDLI